MGTFFSYIFLGLTLAAPIGPVNAAQLDKGIKNGFLKSWIVGLGAMAADGVLMLAIYLGFVNFLQYPLVKSFLWSFGFFVLVYTGVESIINAGKINSDVRKGNESSIKTFFSGFLISISNPLSILFWLGIFGSIIAKTIEESNQYQVLMYSIAIFMGIFIWDITMAMIASTFRKMMTNKILVYISLFSGLSLIGFGTYFGYQAIKILFF